jgi:hypothetical protein
MAFSNLNITAIQEAMADAPAGNSLVSAILNGCPLSNLTLIRLQDVMGSQPIGNDINAAIQGKQTLSFLDLQTMISGFASAQLAADVISNIAGGISPTALNRIHTLFSSIPNPIPASLTNLPVNVSMPAGFSMAVGPLGGLQQIALTFPAGSAFPASGPGSFFEIQNVGNANRYAVWFNVPGGATPQVAQAAAQATYTSLSTMTSTPISATLDGQTLTPGVYSAGAPHLATSGAGTLTFNGAGVYVIIASSTLTTGAGGTPTMTLSGGATAANIYWIVGSSATINSGTAGTFQGNVIAQASVTDTLGGTVNGSLIALTGAVTLSAASIVNAQSSPLLNAAGPYGLLGASGVTNTGSSVINGDVGSYPTNSVTGFPPGVINPIAGGNTNPTPGGYTGIEVSITSGASAATVAADVYAALNGNLIGMNESVSGAVVDITINAILSQVNGIVFSPPAGTYASTQSVSLSAAQCGVSLYYTTNGSTPTTSSTLYTGPISVSASETIKVLGVKNGFQNSAIASAAYVIS